MKTVKLFLAGVLFLTVAQTAFGQEHTRVAPEFTLKPDQSIFSKDGRYKLWMQKDGNLVLYKIVSGRRTPLWSSNTSGRAVERCVFQRDGNLVVYGFSNKVVWAAASDRKGGSYMLLQNDGNLVIYNRQDRPIWASNTDERHRRQ